MSTINFTAPANHDCEFPDTIRGTYTLQASVGIPPKPPTPISVTTLPPAVNVWLVEEDEEDGYASGPHQATVTPADPPTTPPSGTWELDKPEGVPDDTSFEISATVSHRSYPSDTKHRTGITT